MDKKVTVSLSAAVMGDILDHLRDGVEVWRNTVEYLASGCIVAPSVVAECSSGRKARQMMNLYEEAISVIEKAAK